MNDIGDSKPVFDMDRKDSDESSECTEDTDELEINFLKDRKKHHKSNLLINAQKSFVFLEYRSLVNFLETDGEYIVSAGRDHDVNVWDAIEGRHIRRLSGHTAPVTGLSLYSPDDSKEKIIASASEDGTIRKWSIQKGEIEKIETYSLITCMGVINNILAVTGNHKGYIEVRHLGTGDLYTSILAHEDPIDAIAVDGNYACSAMFDSPSCLKVWEIQFEQTVCIYRIENSSDIQFCSLALWNTTAVLGASDQQKLHVIHFKTDKRESIDLRSPSGRVQHVKIWNEWILACSACNKDGVLLDVYRINNYEYFGTFYCNMKQVFAATAMLFDSGMKIVLGGSALAVLSFDFILTQEVKAFIRSICNKSNFARQKSKCLFSWKNITDVEGDDERSSDSEDNSYVIPYSHPEDISQSDDETDKIHLQTLQSDKKLFTSIGKVNNEVVPDVRQVQMPISIINSLNVKDNMLFQSEKNTFQSYAEPRVTARKFKELDESNQSEDLEERICNMKHFETLKAAGDILVKECKENLEEENCNEAKYEDLVKNEKEQNAVKAEETNTEEHSDLLHIDEINAKNEGSENKMQENEQAKQPKRLTLKKKEKSKTNKKKSSEKTKHKRCGIM